jgi:hypothetical protein
LQGLESTVRPFFFLVCDYPVLRSFVKPISGAYIYVTNEYQVIEVDIKKKTLTNIIPIPRNKTLQQVLETSPPGKVRLPVRQPRNMFDLLKDVTDFEGEFKNYAILRFILDNLHAIKCLCGNYVNVVGELLEALIANNEPGVADKVAEFDYRYSMFLFSVSKMSIINLFNRMKEVRTHWTTLASRPSLSKVFFLFR